MVSDDSLETSHPDFDHVQCYLSYTTRERELIPEVYISLIITPEKIDFFDDDSNDLLVSIEPYIISKWKLSQSNRDSFSVEVSLYDSAQTPVINDSQQGCKLNMVMSSLSHHDACLLDDWLNTKCSVEGEACRQQPTALKGCCVTGCNVEVDEEGGEEGDEIKNIVTSTSPSLSSQLHLHQDQTCYTGVEEMDSLLESTEWNEIMEITEEDGVCEEALHVDKSIVSKSFLQYNSNQNKITNDAEITNNREDNGSTFEQEHDDLMNGRNGNFSIQGEKEKPSSVFKQVVESDFSTTLASQQDGGMKKEWEITSASDDIWRKRSARPSTSSNLTKTGNTMPVDSFEAMPSKPQSTPDSSSSSGGGGKKKSDNADIGSNNIRDYLKRRSAIIPSGFYHSKNSKKIKKCEITNDMATTSSSSIIHSPNLTMLTSPSSSGDGLSSLPLKKKTSEISWEFKKAFLLRTKQKVKAMKSSRLSSSSLSKNYEMHSYFSKQSKAFECMSTHNNQLINRQKSNDGILDEGIGLSIGGSSSSSAAAIDNGASSLMSGHSILKYCNPARVWCFENPDNGRRQFLSADYESFTKEYWYRHETKRHGYEIIPANVPCRLYLDIEFNKLATGNVHPPSDAKPHSETPSSSGKSSPSSAPPLLPDNANIDGDELVKALIDKLIDHLHMCFPIQFPSDDVKSIQRSDVLELDSTTDKKFSKHFIFHLRKKQHKKIEIKNYQDDERDNKIIHDGGIVDIENDLKETKVIVGNMPSTPVNDSNHNWDKECPQLEYLFQSSKDVGIFVKSFATRLLLEDTFQKFDVTEKEKGRSEGEEASNLCTNQQRIEKNSSSAKLGSKFWVWKESIEVSSSDVKGDDDLISTFTQDNEGFGSFLSQTQENNNKSCIIDLGVYTKNRAFRLYGSRKHGSHKPTLRLSKQNTFECSELTRNPVDSSSLLHTGNPSRITCFYEPVTKTANTSTSQGGEGDTPCNCRKETFENSMSSHEENTVNKALLSHSLVVPSSLCFMHIIDDTKRENDPLSNDPSSFSFFEVDQHDESCPKSVSSQVKNEDLNILVTPSCDRSSCSSFSYLRMPLHLNCMKNLQTSSGAAFVSPLLCSQIPLHVLQSGMKEKVMPYLTATTSPFKSSNSFANDGGGGGGGDVSHQAWDSLLHYEDTSITSSEASQSFHHNVSPSRPVFATDLLRVSSSNPITKRWRGNYCISPFKCIDYFVSGVLIFNEFRKEEVPELFVGSEEGSWEDVVSLHNKSKSGRGYGSIRSWDITFAPELNQLSQAESSPSCSLLKGAGYFTITYQISQHKFCERISRPHKSNHIMIVVALYASSSSSSSSSASSIFGDATGLFPTTTSIQVLGKWYQRCHDPECKYFNFRDHKLPQVLLQQINTEWEFITDQLF